MNIRQLMTGFGLLTTLLLPLSATAQARLSRITFVMPQSVDPVRVTITQNGFPYTKIDSGTPGDNSGAPITGLTFLPPHVSGSGGLEVHGAIPADIVGFIPVVEVVLRTRYLGGTIDIDSIVDPDFPSFAPWLAIDASGPNERIFRFIKQSGSAELNVESFFGLFSAVTDDPDFASAPFSVTGYTTIQGSPVPEPGAVALLLGAAVGGVSLLRRRRK